MAAFNVALDMHDASDEASALATVYAALHAVHVHAMLSAAASQPAPAICKDAVKRCTLLLRLLPVSAAAERGCAVAWLANTIQVGFEEEIKAGAQVRLRRDWALKRRWGGRRASTSHALA